MSREIPSKAKNTSRSGAFSAGVGFTRHGNDQGAGGVNLSDEMPKQDGGASLNKGRLRPGTEVHHGGGTASIGKGSTEPSR